MIKKGIDVSVWDGNIDFNAVKANEIDFVIIRAGYGSHSSGIDKLFEQNYYRAKKANLNVGAYWYSYAKSTKDALLEANTCMNAIKGKQFDYPIYLDVEEPYFFTNGKEFCDSIITSLAMLSISELGGVLFEERYPLNPPFIIIEGKSTYP